MGQLQDALREAEVWVHEKDRPYWARVVHGACRTCPTMLSVGPIAENGEPEPETLSLSFLDGRGWSAVAREAAK